LIVGESRGAEVLPMLLAMSQGNDGSLSTIHASSSRGTLSRLATYTLQAGEQLSVEAANLLIAGAVHVVVHIGWDRPGREGRRVVTSVREVTGADGNQVASNEIFSPGVQGLAVPASPPTDALFAELRAVGAPPNLFTAGGGDENRGGAAGRGRGRVRTRAATGGIGVGAGASPKCALTAISPVRRSGCRRRCRNWSSPRWPVCWWGC
jgi:hypothetical protein